MFEKKEKFPIDWLKCPICGSKNFMYNKRSATYWCRKCGTEFKANFFAMYTSPVGDRFNKNNKSNGGKK